jgi:uncharacterized protein YegL
MSKLVQQLSLNLMIAAAGSGARRYIGLKRRGCRRRLWGCFGLIFLIALLACVLLFLAAGVLAAAEPATDDAYPLAVYLLIDNSNSMYAMEGLGTDPDFLRLDAARLFISYLGVDDSRYVHRCGVIFFGSEARIVVPLSDLLDDSRRAEMFALIQEPPDMGWTDQAAALALARADLAQQTAVRPAVVLLTDGKPEWKARLTAAEQEAYIARLESEGASLAAAGIPLFIVLLANEVTDADPEIAAVWRPVWQRLAEMTPPGHFYTARQAADLPGIYHDIVVTLTGGLTAGAVIDQVSGPEGLRETVVIEPDLARLTLVVSKGKPGLTVTILQPDHTLLTGNLNNVRFAGQPGVTNEEIWVVERPAAGEWTVLVSGEGRVTVWKDYRLQPATPTITSTATATVTPTPAATAAPTNTAVATARPAATATARPAASVTPQPSPTALSVSLSVGEKPKATEPTRTGDGRLRLWLLVFLMVGGLGGLAGYYQWYAYRPSVTGELRHLSGPGFSSGEPVVELDGLNLQAVRVGAPPAEVPLAAVTNTFTLRAGRLVGDCHETLINGPADIELDGRALQQEDSLADGSIIKVGATRLRYENLRWRSAARSLL